MNVSLWMGQGQEHLVVVVVVVVVVMSAVTLC